VTFITDGEIEVLLRMDNGEEILVDTLSQGSHIGASSILIEAPSPFYFKAKTDVTVSYLFKETIERLRYTLSDLDDACAN
jgi:CRP-like cAMP-binding protein